LVGGAAEGAYYTTTLYTVKKASQTQRNFVELYQQRYQTSPPYIAAECYDVVHLIARAAKDATASSSSELKGALSRIKDIDLAMGKATIDNRDALLPLVIMQIRDGQPTLVRE
jgi:ABC-type branched-subunit amino acid transport system substrate-binding protein